LIADRQHGEPPGHVGRRASQTGVPARSVETSMAKAYCPVVGHVLVTVTRKGVPFLAIVFAQITGGIGSESPDYAVDRVLKSATSVGYSFVVNARGVEIERASQVQTSLEQKDTKATKTAHRDLSGESVKVSHGFSFFLMGPEHLESTKSESGIALVQGISETARARARSVLRTTIWTCASEPEVRSMRQCETATEGRL
jgi:hypothetical protein